MNTIRTQESFVTRYTHEALNSEEHGKMLRNVKNESICTKKGRTHKDMVHPAADFGCNGYYICSSVSFIVMMLLYEQSRTLQILIISFLGNCHGLACL